MDQIALWRGVPLSDVPRADLEAEFCKAQQEIQRLLRRECDLSVEGVRLMAELARERNKGWLQRVIEA